MLLVVAADESGEAATVRRAADRLGLTTGGLEEAEAAGLITIGDGRIEFRHPLVRSAIYQRAAGGDRRAAHGAIAASLRGDWQATRRAWHRAAAAVEPDEAVAAALEAAADEARSRTGYAAAGRAHERAASLTPDDEARARRELAAADAYWRVGRWQRASELLDAAEERSADPLLRADAQLLRGRIAYFRGETDGTHAWLLEESGQVAALDGRRAAMLAGLALDCAFFTADYAIPLATAAAAARVAQSQAVPLGARDTPWLSAALIFIGEPEAALRFTERLRAELDDAALTQDDLFNLVSVATAYGWLCEFGVARDLATGALAAARQQGSLSLVAHACDALAVLHIGAGNLDAAVAAAGELQTIGRETRQAGFEGLGAWHLADVASIRGERDAVSRLRRRPRRPVVVPRLGLAEPVSSAGCISDWESRRRRVPPWRPASTSTLHTRSASAPAPSTWPRGTSDLGRPDAAVETLERVAPRTRQAWGLAALARCRGLLDDAFDAPFAESIDTFARARTPVRGGPRPASATANGSVARAAASTRASSCAPPLRCSSGCARSPGPNACVTSSAPRERPCPSDPTPTLRDGSRRRSSTSPWPSRRAPATVRSPPASS